MQIYQGRMSGETTQMYKRLKGAKILCPLCVANYRNIMTKKGLALVSGKEGVLYSTLGFGR